MTDQNLQHKANSCLADLKFLLGIVPAEWLRTNEWLRAAIKSLEKPTEEKITSAWQFAALIHDKIRQHGQNIDCNI